MEAGRDTRAVALAVAALHFVIEGLEDEPIHPSLDLRAILAFLHLHSDGDRKPFDDFWATLINPFTGQTQRRYTRQTWARSHWFSIRRAVSGDPAFNAIYAKIVRQYQLKHDPDFTQRDAASRAVRLAGGVNALEATKGHPRSAGSARLAAYMRANGGSAKGYETFIAADPPAFNDGNDCGWL